MHPQKREDACAQPYLRAERAPKAEAARGAAAKGGPVRPPGEKGAGARAEARPGARAAAREQAGEEHKNARPRPRHGRGDARGNEEHAS